jgi:hypothetical protein
MVFGRIMLGALALGAGADYLRRRFYEDGPANCTSCDKEFSFLKRSRNLCDLCDSIVCPACGKSFLKKIYLCLKCTEKVTPKIEKILVVKSANVEGHRILNTLGRIQSQAMYRKRKHAERDLLYQCVKAGGNAILSFDVEKDSNWISSNQQFGIPGLTFHSTTSVFSAEGTAAIIEEGTQSECASVPLVTISDELEKLAALKDKGILTEEEFLEQKKKMLGKS